VRDESPAVLVQRAELLAPDQFARLPDEFAELVDGRDDVSESALNRHRVSPKLLAATHNRPRRKSPPMARA
jgi:hypothetical protein